MASLVKASERIFAKSCFPNAWKHYFEAMLFESDNSAEERSLLIP